MSPETQVRLGPEFVQVLLTLNVGRFRAMKREAEPHLPELSAADALVALHMVRCMVPAITQQAREYSRRFLKEQGYEWINGRWEESATRATTVFAEAVGISSGARGSGRKGPLNREIEHAMSDAVLDCLAKGIREPQMQRERMMKARGRIRQRQRLD